MTPLNDLEWKSNSLMTKSFDFKKKCPNGLTILMNTKTKEKALTRSDGSIRHYRNDTYHNTAGPAIIHPNGIEEYWTDGKFISFGYNGAKCLLFETSLSLKIPYPFILRVYSGYLYSSVDELLLLSLML